MHKIKKSNLFKKQIIEFAENYKDRAGFETAGRFLDCIDEAIEFISHHPLACAIYHEAHENAELQKYEYRKWRVKTFPFSVYFRIIDNDTILLEAIYAHRMDVIKRMPSEIKT